MLEIYDKTSSRQRDKRTRALGRELGETRLAEVRRRFEERLNPRALDRVQFRSPRANAEPVEGSSRIVIEVRRKK